MKPIQLLKQRAIIDAKVFLSLYDPSIDPEWISDAWSIALDERAPGTRCKNARVVYFDTFRKYCQAHFACQGIV